MANELTNQEAIEILNDIQSWLAYKSSNQHRAIDMAIQALEEQTMAVAIKPLSKEDRDKFIELLEKSGPQSFEECFDPKPKARWCAKNFHTCYCTNCDFMFDIMKCDFMDKMKFCPNCGSDMRCKDD